MNMETIQPFPLASLLYLRVELILLSIAILIIMIDLFCRKNHILPWVSVGGILLSLLVLVITPHGTAFGNMFIVDGYAIFFKTICLISVLFTVLLSESYLKVERLHQGEYYGLLIFSTVGMMLMTSGGDLIVIYLGLELMALSVYCLVGLLKHDILSNEAALKYFLTGAFSSAILLYGMSLLYGLTGTTNLQFLSEKIVSLNLMNNYSFLTGLGFVIVAFCFKVAAAPFHMWTPDVYEGAPSSVTAFMAVAPKAAAFAVLGRILLFGFYDVHIYWGDLLACIAIITMGIGNIVAIAQKNIKRMLAYSSIAHAGYALLGIIAGNNEGLSATMNYLFIYVFMSMGAFAVIILLYDNNRRGENLDDYRGLYQANPLAAIFMLVFLFSLAGLPPTAGFIAKFYLLFAAFKAGYILTVIAAVLFSVVSAYYYLRVIRYMFFEDPLDNIVVPMPTGAIISLTLAMLGMVAMAVFPATIMDLARRAIM